MAELGLEPSPSDTRACRKQTSHILPPIHTKQVTETETSVFTVFYRRTHLGQQKQQECHLPRLLAPESYTGVPDQGNLHHTGALAPKRSRNIILAFLDSSETGRHIKRRVEWMLSVLLEMYPTFIYPLHTICWLNQVSGIQIGPMCKDAFKLLTLRQQTRDCICLPTPGPLRQQIQLLSLHPQTWQQQF